MQDPLHFLITAGPTREPLDPVRYLSNRSSGRMGYAIAAAAARAGHRVTLISGPVNLPPPDQVDLISVSTAQEMYNATSAALRGVDIAIFAAAVADYRPAQPATSKIKKATPTFTLTLERTPDILGSVREEFGYRGLLVGFAAETDDVLQHAREKLQRKGCDILVANDVSGTETGFDSAENEITLLFAGGEVRPLPRDSKSRLGEILVGVCLDLVDRSGA